MFLRSTSCVVLAWVLCAPLAGHAAERNWWPFKVERETQVGRPPAWNAFGPFAFYQPLGDGRTAEGLRPFYVQRHRTTGEPEGGTVLYPLIRWEQGPQGHHWTFFNLIHHRRVSTPDGAANLKAFEIWPFYLSRQTGEPESSYRAVFPLYGDVRNRFGNDRWKWVLFPFYSRFEENDVATITAPWPFVKVLRGDGNRGVEIWPLAGERGKPGVYRTQFALWPLLYRHETNLSEPEPSLQAGFLPFYAIDRKPGYRSETYGWPFWGYVDRTEPYQYHARHYFWPFWVQGRGDQRSVNRWAPFYTHSKIRDAEKRWILWPLWREEDWIDSERAHERRQLLFFLYHSTVQRSRANPEAAPATKRHYWPLASTWDNGAGRRQVQVLSPLEVFFPHNEHIRLSWSPFFAIYRYDQTAPGELRHSLLWDAVTYRRSATTEQKTFQLGPVLAVESGPDGRRFSLFNGLIGLGRTSTTGWRFFTRGRAPSLSSDPVSSP